MASKPSGSGVHLNDDVIRNFAELEREVGALGPAFNLTEALRRIGVIRRDIDDDRVTSVDLTFMGSAGARALRLRSYQPPAWSTV